MKKKQKKILFLVLYIFIGLIVLGALGAWVGWRYINKAYEGTEAVRIYIPSGATAEAVGDSLRRHLGDSFGGRVFKLWQMQHSETARAYGSYVVQPGDKAISVSRNLRFNRQSPVKVTFNNIRTLDQLAARISSQMAFESADFRSAVGELLPKAGFADTCQYTAAFLPDTYEFYWTAPAIEVVQNLLDTRNAFWTAGRRQQARALGLTPVQVATLASIVEEETNKTDERPLVARLYLNRVNSGMKLQADPTVKFAAGDFSLRRIGGEVLRTDSPYNTYMYRGLPPGPIRVAEASTIDGVLNAPAHDYLYMCASLDRPGYHDFAHDFATHRANARRYQEHLNRRGITL